MNLSQRYHYNQNKVEECKQYEQHYLCLTEWQQMPARKLLRNVHESFGRVGDVVYE